MRNGRDPEGIEGEKMSEQKIISVMNDFVEAIMKQDVEKALSFLTEDIVWVQPEGTFKGKEEVRLLLVWMPKSFWYGQLKIREDGIGILVRGKKAVYEQVIKGVSAHGRAYEAPAVSVFEFDDEKIQHYRFVCDRMTLGKQGCGKLGYGGWLDRTFIRGILNTWEGGLH